MVFSVDSVHEVTFGELNICDIIVNIILSINLSPYVRTQYLRVHVVTGFEPDVCSTLRRYYNLFFVPMIPCAVKDDVT